jgi:glycosyltransferase involved in cell wall biosynthesis
LGTYHYFIEKMRRAVRLGHRIFVVCPWLTFGHKGSSEVDGVEVVRTWPPMLNVVWAWPFNRIVRRWYQWQTQRAVRALVRRARIDVVYVWQARETGYAIARIKNELGAPFIFRQITAWKWHFDRPVSEVFGKKQWYKWAKRGGVAAALDAVLAALLDRETQKAYARAIYEHADRVVLLSKAAVREAVEFGLDPLKAEVLGVAIEQDLFQPLPRPRSDMRRELGIPNAPTVLFIGRINFAEKGVGVLLEAFALVQKAIPAAQLVIVGGGEIARAEHEIMSLGIGAKVRLAGKKQFDDLPKYISSADVFAVPSLWMEAFGQVTIEAMSCGIPVVTSDAGASPEINIDGETGFVTPAGDAQALASAIKKLLQDENLRKRMGEAARKRVLENYTYDVMVNKFVKICEEVKEKKIV